MMCGPGASGKTTLANNMRVDHEIVGPIALLVPIDELRRTAGYNPLEARDKMEFNEGLFAGAEGVIGAVLRDTEATVISDNTHPGFATRERERQRIKTMNPGGAVLSLCVYVATPQSERRRRATTRPDKGASVRMTKEKFQEITASYYGGDLGIVVPTPEENLIVVSGIIPYRADGKPMDQRRQIISQLDEIKARSQQ